MPVDKVLVEQRLIGARHEWCGRDESTIDATKLRLSLG
jgi:hypothetical protein